MGDKNRQRTQDLHQAARRYTLAKQAEHAIEQHNFDRLIERGMVKSYTSHRGYDGDCAEYVRTTNG